MKMKATRNKILPIIVCLLVLFPFTAKAQYGFDVASIEAYINDHKQQRSLLLFDPHWKRATNFCMSTAVMPISASGTSIRNLTDTHVRLTLLTFCISLLELVSISTTPTKTSVTVWVIIKTCLKTSERSVWTEETL